MSSLTRAQIRRAAQRHLQEKPDTPGWLDPDGWNIYIDEVTDELARLDGYKIPTPGLSFAVVSGTADYCTPDLYRITAVVVSRDESGDSPMRLRCVAPEVFDQENSVWRYLPAPTGAPYVAIMNGITDFQLFPTPDYSCTGYVEGYGTPSSAGSGGANVWPLDSSTCPLPARMHVAVSYGAAERRCAEFADDPRYAQRLAWVQQKYTAYVQTFQAELEDFTEATRFGDAPKRDSAFMFGFGF